MNRPWLADAACAGDTDPTWISDPRGTHPGAVARCIAVCVRDCPVILECETWAAREPGFAGIAGGRQWRSRGTDPDQPDRRVPATR